MQCRQPRHRSPSQVGTAVQRLRGEAPCPATEPDPAQAQFLRAIEIGAVQVRRHGRADRQRPASACPQRRCRRQQALADLADPQALRQVDRVRQGQRRLETEPDQAKPDAVDERVQRRVMGKSFVSRREQTRQSGDDQPAMRCPFCARTLVRRVITARRRIADRDQRQLASARIRAVPPSHFHCRGACRATVMNDS